MGTALFLLLFFGLRAAGMPVFLVLGLCAAVLFMISGEPMIGLAQVMINELNSPTLMALPLFVMAAAFMRRGGVAKALVALATALFGAIQGSLGLVTVVACALFASICGSSVATALAMGTILIPAMLERGYPRPFVMGVTGASGTIGVVIPPSLALVLYGIITEQSVPRLFLAGIPPGILQAGAFAVWVIYYARKKGFPREPAVPFRQTLCSIARAAPAMTSSRAAANRRIGKRGSDDDGARDERADDEFSVHGFLEGRARSSASRALRYEGNAARKGGARLPPRAASGWGRAACATAKCSRWLRTRANARRTKIARIKSAAPAAVRVAASSARVSAQTVRMQAPPCSAKATPTGAPSQSAPPSGCPATAICSSVSMAKSAPSCAPKIAGNIGTRRNRANGARGRVTRARVRRKT